MIRGTWCAAPLGEGEGDIHVPQNPWDADGQPCSPAVTAQEATMPKGFNLRCAAGI